VIPLSEKKVKPISMDQINQNLSLELEAWLSIRDEHIGQLQEELLEARTALIAAQEDIRNISISKHTQKIENQIPSSGHLDTANNAISDNKNQELSAKNTELVHEVEQLQHELFSALQSVKVAQQNIRDVNTIRQEHVAYVNAYQQKTSILEQEVQQWQHDYEQLRIQKGGFGFKTILASGIAATVVGMALGWLIFRQKDPNSVLFSQFSKAAGFNLEYNLSHQQYNEAQKIITDYQNNRTYSPIQPELLLIGNLIKAVDNSSDTSAETSIGYSVVQQDTLSGVRPKPVRSLVVIYDGTVNIHTEAMFNAPILANIKKKDKIDQWDRTQELAKIHTTNSKGKKGVAEDYWYEVETKDGMKGWVFGFFTNASMNRFKPDVPDTLRLVAPIVKKDSLPH
jgi:hypothetical protein